MPTAKTETSFTDDVPADDVENDIEMKYSNQTAAHSNSEEESCGLLSADDGDDDAASDLNDVNDDGEMYRTLRLRKYTTDEDNESSSCFHNIQCLAWFMLGVLVVGCIAVFAPKQPSTPRTSTQASAIVDYQCPAKISKSRTFDQFDEAEYIKEAKQQGTDNMTHFAETFRTSEFDDWGKSYNEVKQGMSGFKRKFFAPHLKSGDSIYESASGIGLNLLMTLEVLHEEAGITDLVVYGNEYISTSVEISNVIFDNITADFRPHKGHLCMGDSESLPFVPSNSFDLVYCGYITPLTDPLGLNEQFGIDLTWGNGIGKDGVNDTYTRLCDADADDWKSAKLNELAQKTQDDWFGQWFGEMVRLAKPGAPVIAEQVSPQLCGHRMDWGGVSRKFWEEGAERYGWDVDVDSVQIVDDKIFERRYHVYMLKNGVKED